MALKSHYKFQFQARQKYTNWDRAVRLVPASATHVGLTKTIKSPFHFLCKVISIKGAVGLLIYFISPPKEAPKTRNMTLNQEKQEEAMKQ